MGSAADGSMTKVPVKRPRADGVKYRDARRLVRIEGLIGEGRTVPEAVWGVIGKGGSYPVASYDRSAARTEAQRLEPEEPRPPDWRLEAWYRRLVERAAPERLLAARQEAQGVLVRGSAAAAATIVELSQGDFRVGRIMGVDADGNPTEKTDPRAAMVALQASEKVLAGVGVSTRGDSGGPRGGVAVQVNAGGEGGVTVNVFEALKRVSQESERVETVPRRVRATVSDAV